MSDDGSQRMHEIEVPVPAEDQQCVKGSAYDASLRYDTSPGERVDWISRSAHDASVSTDTSPSGRVDWSQPTGDTGASGASSQGDNASAE